jgi:hypothetical protein
VNLIGKYRWVNDPMREAQMKNVRSFQPKMLTMKKGRSPSLSFQFVQMV